jgi:hypothetical protein
LAFTFTIIKQTVQGDRKVVYGTFTSTGGSTGGDIQTGLQTVEHFEIQLTGSAVGTNAPAINETFPLTGHTAVTIVTDANAVGLWRAEGY